MLQVFLLVQLSFASVFEAQVIDDVLMQFPSVQMSRQDVKMSEAQELSARGAFDITLDGKWLDSDGNYDFQVFESKIKKPTSFFGMEFYTGFRESQGNLPIYDGAFETLNQGEFNVGLEMPLLRNFMIDSRRANLSKSSLQVQRQKNQLRVTELREVERSLSTFWNWKMAFEKWSIHKNLLDVAKQRDEWLKSRTKAGDISQFERNDNLRTLLSRQSFLLQAELDLKTQQSQLIALLANEDLIKKVETLSQAENNEKFKWEIPQDWAQYQVPIDETIQRAFKERPEFAALAVQKEQLEVDKDLQRNKFLPQLDLKFEYSKDQGVGSPKLGDDNTKVSLQFQVPLQYRNIRGQNQEISSRIQRLEFEKTLLEKQWRAELTALQKSLMVAVERRELSLKELELARKLEQGERVRFKHGDVNVLMVNLREQASAEAAVRVIETTVEVLKAYTALEVRVGKVPFI